jgi:hypothetical protein
MKNNLGGFMKKFLTTVLLLTASALAQNIVAPTKVKALAHAIAHAEGYYIKNSLPNRLHNPGDIRLLPGQHVAGQVGLDKHHYVIFKNDVAGFVALYNLINRIAEDSSNRYSVHMTFAAFARKYVGGPDWSVWLKIVCKTLTVSPRETLEVYFNEDVRTS